MHQYVASTSMSIARGIALEDEAELGTLTLPGFIREVSQRFVDREALVCPGADGSVERWSYAQLWDQSMAVAKSLVATGIGKGDRVGILITNRAEFLSAVFGTALAGGVATPLSTFSTPAELEYLVANACCSALLLERQVLKKDFVRIMEEIEPAIATAAPTSLAAARFPFLRVLAVVDGKPRPGAMETWHAFLARGAAIDGEQVEARAATVTPADPAALFYSSGSTSKPKGILSAHRGVSIQLWRMSSQQGLGDGVRSWTANGFFWSGNFAMIIGGTLARGGALLLQRTFQPEEALELMAAERAAFLFAWPHQWTQLLEASNWESIDLSSLEYVDVDSPIARHPTIQSHWTEPRHAYGNTETFTLSTAYPAGTSRETAGDSHGLPLPGNTLKIVNPMSGDVVAVGERGEIAIKGPTLMLGYLGVPLSDTLDDDGYFRTGDGGYIDAQGRLFWEGRLDDIIKTGGANVSPVEVDDVIRTCPGVKMAQSVGVPDDSLGELVVTCIVALEGATLDENTVRGYTREKLASYKVPRRVLFFSEQDLHLTGSAKIKTKDLRKLAAERLKT